MSQSQLPSMTVLVGIDAELPAEMTNEDIPVVQCSAERYESGVAVTEPGDSISANDYDIALSPCYPLPSNRQHLSYDVCLEVRGEIIRTVLCCIVY